MKAISLILGVIVIIFIGGILWSRTSNIEGGGNNSLVDQLVYGQPVATSTQAQDYSVSLGASAEKAMADFASPLDRAKERITKKVFGIYVTRANSSVQPERFSGYHVGVDFEIFSDELGADVSIKAICTGTIAEKKWANGYGGVLVQNCQLKDQSITVIYGHLNLTSISKDVGDRFVIGEVIGNLGKNKSVETDGERKHLHLGMHKGANIDILGYVQNQNQLSAWIDPCDYVCNN